MTHIARGDAEALATFVRRLRPPAGQPGHWNQAGTIDAIQKCKASLSETAVALIRLAEDQTVRTPALLNSDGHWWFRAARGEQPTGQALRAPVTCPLHPQHPLGTDNCPECQKEAGPPLTPEQITAAATEAKRVIAEARQMAETERRAITERQEAAQ